MSNGHAIVEVTLVFGLSDEEGKIIEGTLGGTTVRYAALTDVPPENPAPEVMDAAMTALAKEPIRVVNVALGVLGFSMVDNPLPGNRLIDAVEASTTRPMYAIDINDAQLGDVVEAKA